MVSGKRTIAVVSADGQMPADVAQPLTRGGFAVAPVSFTAPVSDAAAVLVLVSDPPDAATAFTRRRRADLGSPRPFVWLFSPEAAHFAPTGLDAGADVCLVRPVDADILLAQVNALLRSYSDLSRVVVKGGDTVDLSERLAKQFLQTDTDAEFTRRTLAAFAPRSPLNANGTEVAWVHRPSTSRGVNSLAVVPTADGVRFAVVTVGGMPVPTGAVLAESLTRFLISPDHTPADALTTANRRACDFGLPDAAMVSATVGTCQNGVARVACGGHPPPVFVTSEGSATLWHGGGSFLGQAGAGFTEMTGEVHAGERLLLLGGGAAADKRPDVRAAAERVHGTQSEFVQRMADAVFTPADAADGYMLLAVG